MFGILLMLFIAKIIYDGIAIAYAEIYAEYLNPYRRYREALEKSINDNGGKENEH